MKNITSVLNNYNINGEVINHTCGPLLNIVEFSPVAGTKLKNITSSLEDIRRELCTTSLMVTPSVSSATLLFQYPKDKFDIIDFNEIINSKEFCDINKNYELPINIGVDILGSPIIEDLSKMPHLLVGGTTGSGKSVGLNTFILSLISSKLPSELKLVLIDPKKVEFSLYNNQKYLYCPVITETKDAINTLNHLTKVMDERYELFSQNLCKNIKDYNKKASTPLPYIVCVIDEFADLIATNPLVEKDVMRLAQKARASGIHLILATQRPSVDVITGVLKANFPTRLSYKVASNADSRTILDDAGAENLIGRGDCLFLSSTGKIIRAHGAFIEDDKITEILSPYSCKISPLKLEIPNDGTTKEKTPRKEVKKETFIERFARFWSKLKQKDKDLIIRGIKYIFTFIMGLIGSNHKKRH